MTDSVENVLSTHAKKLSRDIQFATAIGRDSPFDPFQGRDITKIFSEKKQASYSLMYYPNRPPRKSATAALPFGKSTGRNAPTQAPPGPQLVDASYDLSPLPEGPKVTFPKAKRVPLDFLPDASKASSVVKKADAAVGHGGTATVRGGPRSPVGGQFDASALKGLTTLTEEDFMTARQRAMKRATQERPASQLSSTRGATFGTAPGHMGRGLSCDVPQRAASAMSPAHRSTTSTFPWEVQKAKDARLARLKQQQRDALNAPSCAPMGNTAAASPTSRLLGGFPDSPVPEDLNPLDATNDTNLGGFGARNAGGNDDGDAEERWLEQRRQFIGRFGLLGGPSNRRYEGPTGPDIGGMPSRDTPVNFQPRGKERNDVMYLPKDEVTTRQRAVARVELGKQATRFRGPNLHQRHLDKLLSYDYLSKLHRKTRAEEKRQFAGLESAAPRGPVPRRSVVGSSGIEALGPEDVIFHRPLTAADELAYNWSSLRPVTRGYQPGTHTVDSKLCADRSDEPLSAVLGGDPRPYRRAAKREVSTVA